MQKLIQFLTRRRCKSYCQFGQKLPPPYTCLFFRKYFRKNNNKDLIKIYTFIFVKICQIFI